METAESKKERVEGGGGKDLTLHYEKGRGQGQVWNGRGV